MGTNKLQITSTKYQANYKLQAPSTKQIPKFKTQIPNCFEFVFWNFIFVWDLGFGAWNL
jgi:hypothetical protein